MRPETLLIGRGKERKVLIYGAIMYWSDAPFLHKKQNKFSATTKKINSEKKNPLQE